MLNIGGFFFFLLLSFCRLCISVWRKNCFSATCIRCVCGELWRFVVVVVVKKQCFQSNPNELGHGLTCDVSSVL